MLDDLGAEKTSEWVEETMNLIVNTRYNERRPTIFTSNYEDIPDDDRSRTRCWSASASGCTRGCTRCASSSSIDGADYRELPRQRRRRRPADAVEDAQAAAQTLPARAQRPGPRPAARAGDPATAEAELKMVGRQGRQLQSIGQRQPSHARASTSTSRSAPPSATTATSIAACSTPALKARYVDALDRGDRAAAGGRTATPRRHDLLRRRHAVAARARRDRARIIARLPRVVRRRAGRRGHARGQSRDRRRAERLAASATPASIVSASASSRSATTSCGGSSRCTRADRARARRSPRRARAGFDNVSLDLMMWLPEQRVSDWLESVDAADRARPRARCRSICSSSIRTRR